MKWILAAFALVSLNAFAAEATLEIVADKERLIFSQFQLLSRSDLQTISIIDSEYKQGFTRFKAIPIAILFKGLVIPELAVVQCNSTHLVLTKRTRVEHPDARAQMPPLPQR